MGIRIASPMILVVLFGGTAAVPPIANAVERRGVVEGNSALLDVLVAAQLTGRSLFAQGPLRAIKRTRNSATN